MTELDLNEWLKGDDVAPEATITFIDAGEQTTIPQGDGKEAKVAFEIGVQLPNGETKKWTMNLTSQRAIAQAYGKQTENWVNKQAVVFTQDQVVSGTMRKVICARVPVSNSGIQEIKIGK